MKNGNNCTYNTDFIKCYIVPDNDNTVIQISYF